MRKIKCKVGLILSLFLLFPVTGWSLSADANQRFDVAGLPQWSVLGGGAVTQVQCDSSGPTTVCPSEGPNQGKWTCPSCLGGENIILRYTDPAPTAPPAFLGVDIYSSGGDRSVGLRVISSGGVTSTTSTATRCGPGGNPPSDNVLNQNVWDTLYIDLSGFTGTDIRYVELITNQLGPTDILYVDYLRDLSTAPNCSPPTATFTPTPTPTVCLVSGNTCTPTATNTPTVTPTFQADACASNPGTPTCTPTLTGTPTATATPTATPTPTPPPFLVFPNPVDLSGDTHSNLCAQANINGSCVKFRGVHKDSTVTIYTLALAKVRTFTPVEIEKFKVNDPALNPALFPDLRTFVWEGDNDDRNPVSAGIYYYKVEGPVSFKGTLAIKRSRKQP